MASLVLTVLTGSDAGKRVELDTDVEVGSQPDAGLWLLDPAVAPRHARFTVDGEKVRVRDLGSPDGTYRNDVRIEKPKRVRPGDRVRVGQTVLELLTAEQAAADRIDSQGSGEPAPVAAPPATVPAAGPLAHSLRAAETTAHFVPDAAGDGDRAANRYGPLASWTDSRIKHQTHAAAIGLLAVSAIAVLVFLFD